MRSESIFWAIDLRALRRYHFEALHTAFVTLSYFDYAAMIVVIISICYMKYVLNLNGDLHEYLSPSKSIDLLVSKFLQRENSMTAWDFL